MTESEISLVAETVAQLQANTVTDPAHVDPAMQIVSRSLGSIQGQKTCKQLIYSCPDAATQARAIGNLLIPEAHPVLNEVLNTPDERNLVGPQLGPDRINQLIRIADIPEPVDQNTALLQMARDVLNPPSFTPSEALDDPSVAAGVGPDPHPIIGWLQARDVAQIKQALENSPDHEALAQSIATAGLDLAGPLDELMAVEDTSVSDFAYQTYTMLAASGSEGLPQESGSAPIDTAKLDPSLLTDLLMQPDGLPASLSRRFEPTGTVQPVILETTIRNLMK
jgi:hypothetical protein